LRVSATISRGVRRRWPMASTRFSRRSRSMRSAPSSRSAAVSNRCAGSSNRRPGSGRARARPRSSARRRSRSRAIAAPSRRSRSSTRATSSARTGTAISAAALGVGARTSAAKSIRVTSVSWPTAEIRGIAEAAAARTTISSLKAHRSSRLPPPRATISTSGRGNGPPEGSALKPAMAAAISSAAPSPWTRAGQISTRRGKRSARRCRISRMTAPVGEVTTPMTSGR